MLGQVPNSDYHPHVCLAVFDADDLDRVQDSLRDPLQACVGLPLTLASLGFFLTRESVAFLGVVPSVRLLAAHHRVVHAIESLVSGVWPYYEPDVLVPHCTLATDVADRARVIAAVADADLPINTTAAFAHLVEIPGGWSRFQIPTQ